MAHGIATITSLTHSILKKEKKNSLMQITKERCGKSFD
jgi:hypothetical protein